MVPPTLTPPPTERMRLGTALEPVARALYENATGKLVRSAGLHPHPKHPKALAASPDGVVLDSRGRDTKTLLEIKVGQERTPYLSNAYLVQLAVQMACCGAQKVDFVAMHAGTHEFTVTTVERNRSLEDVLIKQLLAAHQEATEDDEVAEYDTREAQALRRALADAQMESVGPARRCDVS